VSRDPVDTKATKSTDQDLELGIEVQESKYAAIYMTYTTYPKPKIGASSNLAQKSTKRGVGITLDTWSK
jgi:hypothetical protein